MTLTKEQLENLRAYVAVTKKGRLVVMPFVEAGEVVRFDCRLYKKGVGGHIWPTVEALESVGMPTDWGIKAVELARALQGTMPGIPVPELIAAKAKVAGLPVGTLEEAVGGVVNASTPEATEEVPPEVPPESTPKATV